MRTKRDSQKLYGHPISSGFAIRLGLIWVCATGLYQTSMAADKSRTSELKCYTSTQALRVSFAADFPKVARRSIQSLFTQAGCKKTPQRRKYRESEKQWISLGALPNDSIARINKRRSHMEPEEYTISWHQDRRGRKVFLASGGTVRADLYAAYRTLELMGFAFLHPLQPRVPKSLFPIPLGHYEKQSPRWPQRGIHMHTQHPTEFCEMLNGWGPDGPDDKQGFQNSLSEWNLFLQWAVANRLNRVQWILLEGKDWKKGFSRSSTRQKRLKKAGRHGSGLAPADGYRRAFESKTAKCLSIDPKR